MSFKYNASDIVLLSNEPIIFFDEENGQKFNFIPPKLKDFYLNDDLNFIITLLDSDIEDLKKMVNLDIKNHYSFLHIVLSLRKTVVEFEKMSIQILNGLSKLIPNIHFDKILRIDDIIVDSNLFHNIIKVLFICLDKKKPIIEPDDDEFTKMEKQAKIRAEKIRNKSKKNDDGTQIKDIIIAILYEFPQYKIEDILDMNMYTIYYLFKYVGKIANYEVSKIAAGNGLAKKHKYFIEK